MKKKLIYATLAGLFLLLFVSLGFGATKIYLPRDNRIKSHFNRFPKFSAAKLKDIIGLDSQENLKLLKKRTDRKKVTHLRYNQLFKGIPIWGHHIIIAEDQSGNIVNLHGTKVSEIAEDIHITELLLSDFGAQQALFNMKERHIENSQLVDQFWQFKNESSRKMIYLDDSGEALICIVVSFFADLQQGGYPSRPTIIMDAGTGKIIKEFDALTYAEGVGPGGNEKTGKYQYGIDFPAFEVDELDFNCVMDTVKVKTMDWHNGSSPPTVHAFECYQNTFKEINGGFCPLNDAHFFGGVVYDLYNEWFDTAPLPFQMVLGVHYGNNFENAIWSGFDARFGDGATNVYPLVGLDVVSHEISHGFTEQNSNLVYDDQPGGINEAFSDMAGEAAEYYLKGSNDFMVGWEVWKGSGALRYMDDPPKDGISIDSANDYLEGMDIHRSSGVFNKAFYNLAVTPGWNTRKAFEVFVKANQDYWEPSTNFVQGAEGAYDAAVSLGYCAQAVKEAFEAVDIFIESRQNPQNPQADFYYGITNFLTVEFTDNSKHSGCDIISWLWEFGDGHESTAQHPTHTYASGGMYTATLTVTDSGEQKDSESKSLQITQDTSPPTAAFSYRFDGLTVSFNDQSTAPDTSIVSWLWEFGDGHESTAQHPTHTYASGGTYTATLTVTDSDGQKDSESKSLTVAGELMDYCESAGQIYYYQWIAEVTVGEFSNSSVASGYSDFVSEVIEIQKATPYSVTLMHGPAGSSYPKYWRIWADLNLDGDFVDPGETLFEGSKNDVITGTITVPMTAIEGQTRLRVSMSPFGYLPPCGSFYYGEVEDYSLKISESMPGPAEPVADFIYIANGLTVSFNDQSTAPDSSIVDWLWEFGDGHESTAQHLTHTYASGGTYTATLTVTDSDGQKDSESKSLQIIDVQRLNAMPGIIFLLFQ